MFKYLSDFNVVAKFKAETSASSSLSSRLPVILLQKSIYILQCCTVLNIYFGQIVLSQRYCSY